MELMTFEHLVHNITVVSDALRTTTIKAVNRMTTLRNWIVGGYIVEYEQHGIDRAKYGERVITNLAQRLKDQRMNATLLKYSRLFYLQYPAFGELVKKSATVSHFFPQSTQYIDNQSDKGSLATIQPISHTLSHLFVTDPSLLISRLSFSHIRELLTIDDPLVRYFYESECIKGVWSVRELRRQMATNLHIRVGLSEDKLRAMQQANESIESQTPALMVKDNYVLEFLGINPGSVITEDDLEAALIDHMQEFLLEMGTGFCLEAKQKRLIIDDEYYYADLVFYNRALHCNVIVELKNDEFRHEYIGQLNAYVGYYAENEMRPGDNPPVGILLCTRKGKKMVEYALGAMDRSLFVSTYQLQLPDPKILEEFILKNI